MLPFAIAHRDENCLATGWPKSMNAFDIAAALAALAAGFAYVNHRWLRLPPTIGVMGLSLLSAVVVLDAQTVFPGWALPHRLVNGVAAIDFNTLVMRGMLGLLLFAGSLHVAVVELLANKWTIAVLATVGVLISTAVVGIGSWWMFQRMGVGLPLAVCLTFGAIVSPTDPIAVIDMLKRLRAPKNWEAMIAGESLFNDGVGVVVFVVLAGVAGLQGGKLEISTAVGLFLRQAVGGAIWGWVAGFVGTAVLRTVRHHELGLLVTLGLAMGTYSAAWPLGVSGPIAAVVAGLWVGHQARNGALDERTLEHVDAFWAMIDHLLNSVLFLLIGLELCATHLGGRPLAAAALTIPIALAGRFVSVAVIVRGMRAVKRQSRGTIPVLTWGGLRGGLCIAMALSLPRGPTQELLLGCTYAIVVFSILIQGTTTSALVRRYCG